MVYQALEQRKLSLNKIAMRYKTIINGKSQPFYLNNLQMKKLVIQAGTIYRRKMFLLTESNAFILEEYDDLYSKHAIPENLTLVNNSISNLNNYNQESNISHEDEFIDEFREYMDDF